jgi:hypothetical protein
MGSMDWAVDMLAEAETVSEVELTLRRSARAGIGADGVTIVRRDGGQCFYADEDAMSPLWKGQRFPMAACISGWAMLNRQTVRVPDIYVDDRIPHDAYRPTFVRSLLMVPIRAESPIGAIGLYWASQHLASDDEVAAIERLAEAASVALASVSAPVPARA